uniref:Uncharacterized protein n=1 Tax=Ananas comosus var. bracteatus TaxID=296719 RepID=A0A6V7PS74_ANACO|nr:unnamed protein product [Ananas comosus var. bracteatus]
MSPRRYVRRSIPAPSPEVPEEAGSSEVRELRAQVSALTGIVQRQESRFEQLQGLIERHFAAATAAATEGQLEANSGPCFGRPDVDPKVHLVSIVCADTWLVVVVTTVFAEPSPSAAAVADRDRGKGVAS